MLPEFGGKLRLKSSITYHFELQNFSVLSSDICRLDFVDFKTLKAWKAKLVAYDYITEEQIRFLEKKKIAVIYPLSVLPYGTINLILMAHHALYEEVPIAKDIE